MSAERPDQLGSSPGPGPAESPGDQLEYGERGGGSGSVCVFARGELDLSCAEEFRALLMRALRRSRHVVLDLSELDFIDSTGLAVIVHAINSARRGRATLELFSSLRSQPRRLMELTGVLPSLTLVDEPLRG